MNILPVLAIDIAAAYLWFKFLQKTGHQKSPQTEGALDCPVFLCGTRKKSPNYQSLIKMILADRLAQG